MITAFTNISGSYAARELFKKYFNQGKELSKATSVGEMPDNSSGLQLSSNKGRAFYIEESDGQMRTIIPDYTPAQAWLLLGN